MGLIFGLAMAYSPPSRFFAAALLSTVLLLSGCCANNICDCKGEAQADAIKLVFGPTFATADLDTLLIQRYPLTITRATRPETVTIIRTAAQARDTLYLNNITPFAQSGTAKLNQYVYVVKYYATPHRTRPVTVLNIDNITLKGTLAGNGCCTCYTNTQKAAAVRKDSTIAVRSVDLTTNPILYIAK